MRFFIPIAAIAFTFFNPSYAAGARTVHVDKSCWNHPAWTASYITFRSLVEFTVDILNKEKKDQAPKDLHDTIRLLVHDGPWDEVTWKATIGISYDSPIVLRC
jgi:hypothetical protein